MSESVILKIFLHRREADAARALLLDEGIVSSVLVEGIGSLREEAMYGTGMIRLMVHPDDLQEAKKVLKNSGKAWIPEDPKKEPLWSFLKWKIYFFINLILLFLSLGNLFPLLTTNFDFDSLISILDTTTTLVCALGLYGYAFNKRFLNAVFWKIFFWVYILYCLKNVGYILWFIVQEQIFFKVSALAGFIFGLATLIMSAIALYRYPVKLEKAQDYVY